MTAKLYENKSSRNYFKLAVAGMFMEAYGGLCAVCNRSSEAMETKAIFAVSLAIWIAAPVVFTFGIVKSARLTPLWLKLSLISVMMAIYEVDIFNMFRGGLVTNEASALEHALYMLGFIFMFAAPVVFVVAMCMKKK